MRRISDSKNEMAEKHQHVPVLLWFLIEVVGISITVSNWYPSGWAASFLFFFWAESAGEIMQQMHNAVIMCLIDIVGNFKLIVIDVEF